MDAADRLEREILEWLGLLADSDPPNEEVNYESRLRKLGTSLHAKGWGADECLVALALRCIELSREDPKARLELLGRARQLTSGARTLAMADRILFESIGRDLGLPS